MQADALNAMRLMREFMFERVYLRPESRAQAERARRVIHDLVGHLSRHPDLIPATYQLEGEPLQTRVLDYVAGMTDRYALNLHDRWFRPRGLV